jgi:hypothetical protein
MPNKSMQLVREKIQEITFEHDREDRALKAIEIIYTLCCSRDGWSVNKMEKTKLGNAFLDIAEFYGEHAPQCRENFRNTD